MEGDERLASIEQAVTAIGQKVDVLLDRLYHPRKGLDLY